MPATESALPEIRLGTYLFGDAVDDPSVRGQHPLFYGTVRLQGEIRDRQGYLKLLPPRQLFAESMSAALGRHMGLPVPETAIVVARGDRLGVPGRVCIGVASIDVGAVPISRIVNAESVNDLLNQWAHLKAAIVFDELIANGDRHLRNLLLGADGKIWMIDHEEALGDPLTAPARAVRNQLLHQVIDDLSEFQRHKAGKLLREKLTSLGAVDFKAQALASQPSACQVSDAHMNQVVEFLTTRVHHMGNLLDNGLGLRQRHLFP